MRDFLSKYYYFVQGLYCISNTLMNIEGSLFMSMKWRIVYVYSYNNQEVIKYLLLYWGKEKQWEAGRLSLFLKWEKCS